MFTLRYFPEEFLLFREYYGTIFEHNFVKAFFGKQKHKWDSKTGSYCIECCSIWAEIGEENIHCWQYHLQQMILEKEPLNYLEKFLL